jgi:hypothetical protein
MRSEWILGRQTGGAVDSPCSGQGQVAGSGECGDKPPGSDATQIV